MYYTSESHTNRYVYFVDTEKHAFEIWDWSLFYSDPICISRRYFSEKKFNAIVDTMQKLNFVKRKTPKEFFPDYNFNYRSPFENKVYSMGSVNYNFD